MMKDEKSLSIELNFPLGSLNRVSSDPRSFYFYQRRQLGKKNRVLRIPQEPLMEIQRAIKVNLLDPMPLAKSVHGWRKKRSPMTYTRDHVGKGIVLNADIQDFFPSVNAGRVYRFWIEAGYAPGAAKLLTSLTTLDNQLPQGAPTSQSVGNQVLRGLNHRLSGLARQHRLNFGSYGDEVSLSGRRRAAKLKGLTLRIIEQEGFKANPNKVKVMPRNRRQELAGNIVNKKNGPGRPKYRDLRAILHNCLRFGSESQNREMHPNFKQHLRGRIGQFQYANPRLGDQLLVEFEKIRWKESV